MSSLKAEPCTSRTLSSYFSPKKRGKENNTDYDSDSSIDMFDSTAVEERMQFDSPRNGDLFGSPEVEENAPCISGQFCPICDRSLPMEIHLVNCHIDECLNRLVIRTLAVLSQRSFFSYFLVHCWI